MSVIGQKKRVIEELFIVSIFIGTILLLRQPRINTSIFIHIPEKMQMNFYSESNDTIEWTSEYDTYFIMINWEAENGEESGGMSNHIYNPMFLSYAFDIWDSTLNETDLRLHPEFYLNGVIKEINIDDIVHNWDSLMINAFDFSIINETNYCKSMDFGNIPFFTINNTDVDLYINGINFYPTNIKPNAYVPYLSITVGDYTHEERMAWGNVVNPNQINFII